MFQVPPLPSSLSFWNWYLGRSCLSADQVPEAIIQMEPEPMRAPWRKTERHIKCLLLEKPERMSRASTPGTEVSMKAVMAMRLTPQGHAKSTQYMTFVKYAGMPAVRVNQTICNLKCFIANSWMGRGARQ